MTQPILSHSVQKVNHQTAVVALGVITFIALAALVIFAMRSKQAKKPLPSISKPGPNTTFPEKPQEFLDFLANKDWQPQYKPIKKQDGTYDRDYLGIEELREKYVIGWTLLHFAAAEGSCDDRVKQLIIAHDYVDLDAKSFDDETIVDVAKNQELKDWLADRQKIQFEQLKYRFEHRDVWHIEHNCTKEMFSWRDEQGCTLLHYVVGVIKTNEEMEKEEELCGQVLGRCKYGLLVKTLVKKFDPDLSIQNKEGKTVADLTQDDSLKKWLFDSAQIIFDRDHDRAIEAIKVDDDQSLKEIIQRNVNSRKLLQEAASEQSLKCFRLLMSKNPDLSAQHANDSTILDWALVLAGIYSRPVKLYNLIHIVRELLQFEEIKSSLNRTNTQGEAVLDDIWHVLSIYKNGYQDDVLNWASVIILFEIEKLLVDAGAHKMKPELDDGLIELKTKFLTIWNKSNSSETKFHLNQNLMFSSRDLERNDFTRIDWINFLTSFRTYQPSTNEVINNM